jgi:hypothetical protein
MKSIDLPMRVPIKNKKSSAPITMVAAFGRTLSLTGGRWGAS